MTSLIGWDARLNFDLGYFKELYIYNTIALASLCIKLHFSCICDIQQIVNACSVIISLQHNMSYE